MKNKKMIMALAITLMAIGFAGVSTVLYLNGQTFVASNTGDFDVYFSKAIENGTENASIIKDKTHIEFTTELTGLNDKYVLDYDVTNGSKQYDANLVMNCTGGNEYLRVSNRFDTTEILPARTTRSGVLTLTVIKVPLTEMSVSISCEISGNAVERDAAGGDAIEKEQVDGYLASAVPLNKNEGKLQEEFIIKKFGTVEKANEWQQEVCKEGYDSETCQNAQNEFRKEYEAWKITKYGSYLWSGLDEVLQNLTSADNQVKASVQFLANETLPASVPIEGESVESINFVTTNQVPENVIRSWDASEQQNGSIMAWILDEDHNNMYEIYIGQNGKVKANSDSSYLFAYFYGVKDIKGLENLDTSKVENMSSMFKHCKKITTLNLTTLNTSLVTDMSYMFDGCDITTLDVSNWNTSKVKNMYWMFYECSSLTNLDLRNFDTSNVTNMGSMFSRCDNLTNLDLRNFDTSNVTNMNYMFVNCYKLTTTITIRGTKCTTYGVMFENSATSEGTNIIVNYTADASDLVDKMIATKSSASNVVKGTQVV